ncbi:MAG: hypothetical protein K0R29_2146 [Pseudobdellovibrio sp.]|jgi:hypothetical protein|nr:hypothetical protein [Pseudobdellovibrio sp.]
MKLKGLILSLLFLTSGCVSVEFVRKDFNPEKKAILRHTPPSNEKRNAEYRDLIKQKASEFCGGEYTVTKEYQAQDISDSSVGVGTGFGFGNHSSIMIGGSRPTTSMYNFVEVSCHTAAPAPATAPVPAPTSTPK